MRRRTTTFTTLASMTALLLIPSAQAVPPAGSGHKVATCFGVYDALLEMADIEKELFEEIKPILNQPGSNDDAASMEKLKAYYYKKKYLNRILERLGD